MKESICAVFGVVGSFIAGLFGGWDASLATLLIFMGVDYITGLIVAAAGKSQKSENGHLSSLIGWKGLAKKGVSLLLVLVAVRLDIMLGTSYIRDGVCIAFMVNELISIVENAGLLGVPMPEILTKAIDLLQGKSDSGKDD
ncbi:phage holin family protein [Ruminococcus sp.]|uniref:phage holin family protein n=1 Tax=Ruminococcus sp. TaxID=41978 RepID=UPI0025F2208E|nr:phage holin family protein [Ruminococcus sp.]